MGSKKESSSKEEKIPFLEANGESENLLKICVFWIVLGKKRIGGKIISNSWFSVICGMRAIISQKR